MVVTYTEVDSGYVAPASTGWQEIDISAYVPAGCVVEMLIISTATWTERWIGLRNTSSSISRALAVVETEAGGSAPVRMYAQVDGDGKVDFYAQSTNNTYWKVVGYWTGVTFTEAWEAIDDGSSTGWVEDVSLPTNDGASVHHFVCGNEADAAGRTMGVRVPGSALDRFLNLNEAEAGGANTIDIIAMSDSSGNIDYYTDVAGDEWIYNAGYFSKHLIFVENEFTDVAGAVDDAWTDTDISGYLDRDGRIADFACLFQGASAENETGVRGNDYGSLSIRYILIHAAEGNGTWVGYGMSATSDSSGIVEYYAGNSNAEIQISGYFIPTLPWDVNGVDRTLIKYINGVPVENIASVNGVDVI